MLKINEPLLLDGAKNIRELGGYKTLDGRTTVDKVFLRGDKTDILSQSDMDKLVEYGLRLEIDLRSLQETEHYPSKFFHHSEVEYKNVIMFDTLALFASERTMPKSLFELYRGILDSALAQYIDIFRSFINCEGVSFFHCSAGKDRAGMLAMLILDLAGVPDETIIADYSASEKNLELVFRDQRQKLGEFLAEDIPEFLFTSKAEDMEETLDFFRDKYTGARNYLKTGGLSDHELDIIVNRFIK